MAGITIDQGACVGCGACVGACPVEVIAMEGDKAKNAKPEACVECGACVDACPVSCITL